MAELLTQISPIATKLTYLSAAFVAILTERNETLMLFSLYEQERGEVSSPRHPETYETNLNCEWVIRVPPQDR